MNIQSREQICKNFSDFISQLKYDQGLEYTINIPSIKSKIKFSAFYGGNYLNPSLPSLNYTEIFNTTIIDALKEGIKLYCSSETMSRSSSGLILNEPYKTWTIERLSPLDNQEVSKFLRNLEKDLTERTLKQFKTITLRNPQKTILPAIINIIAFIGITIIATNGLTYMLVLLA